jgi:signal transduction histidine kinase
MNPAPELPATRAEGKTKTVLIVDDCPGSLGVVVSHLERHGLRVVVARDGEEGLTRAQHVRPDLILLDVLMPGMDGFETCRRLKAAESTRDIPVIFVTVVTDAAGKVTGFHAGGVDYVTKPFQLDEVLARVTTHMRLHELTQELEQKVLEQTLELRAANESLRESDRRKDEFLAMLAHELRNPLGPILSSTYILSRALPEADQGRRAVLIIERQARHLAHLVDELLDVTRIARGKVELKREPVELRELVRRAGEDLRIIFDTRGVELAIETPEQELWADGDPLRLTQIIGNLLQNAQKFTDPGGRVTLSLVAGDQSVAEIRVRDNGIGIAPELLEHVFEPFVQGDGSLARTEGGLGLGLAVVKGVTELHGGTVCATSAGPTRGAEFVVRLPLLGGMRTPAERPAASPPTVSPHRVLIVEDNPDAAEGLAEIVRMLGHACDVAHDGPSALVAIEATHPDVVLCDLGLPGMTGFDVAKTLRQGGSAVRLVAISGYTRPADVKKAAASGFDAHLAKPINFEDIERLLG